MKAQIATHHSKMVEELLTNPAWMLPTPANETLRQTYGRHVRIEWMLARDVITRSIAPDLPVAPAQDLQIEEVREGNAGDTTAGLLASVRLRISAADLATHLVDRLDEAMGLGGALTMREAHWPTGLHTLLAEVALDVADRVSDKLEEPAKEVEQAVTASNHGLHGVAEYLIERLGVGAAFDALAKFCAEHAQFLEQAREEQAPAETMTG